MSKKLTKEQLENDALVTSYARTVYYIQDNTAKIVGIVIAVLLLISTAIGYTIHSKNQEVAAQAFLGNSEAHFASGDFESALFGDNSIYGVGFEEIIANYSRTDAANMARYYAAISYSELGDNDLALAHMNRFKAPKGILGVGPLSFHAALLSDVGQYSTAAATFKKAANWDVNDATTPQNLLRAAEAAMQAGDKRMASDLVKEILEKYDFSTAATNARKISGMLAAK
jgi:tetratricopeptide (TPR) repeat protein